MATSAQYAATPANFCFTLSTANTNLDGTGTLATAFTAGVNGSIVDAIFLKATAATTDNLIRIFMTDGTNTNVMTEVIVQATTPSTTSPVVQTFETIIDLMGITLPSGWSLKVSTNNAETYKGIGMGGHL